MIEMEKPKIETIEINDDAKYGKFVIEPLEREFGTSLGNSLRLILLSLFLVLLLHLSKWKVYNMNFQQ